MTSKPLLRNMPKIKVTVKEKEFQKRTNGINWEVSRVHAAGPSLTQDSTYGALDFDKPNTISHDL